MNVRSGFAGKSLLAGLAVLAAPAAFADYTFQFRGPVTSCVSNSGGCEATEEIVLELTLDSDSYTLGTDVNEADTNEPRALRKYNYYIELNYPPNPPTSTGRHIIISSSFSNTGFNTPDFAFRAFDLPSSYFIPSAANVDLSGAHTLLPNRTISVNFVSNAQGWSIQWTELDAKSAKYTRYSGQGNLWRLLLNNIVIPPGLPGASAPPAS